MTVTQPIDKTIRKLNLTNPIVLSLLNNLSTYVFSNSEFLKEADNYPHIDSDLDCISNNYLNACMASNIENYHCAEYENAINLGKKQDVTIDTFTKRLKHYLNVNKMDSLALYPKRAKLSWHHNANSPGYHLLFIYSIDGNGYFKHMDHDKNLITLPDPKGWSCQLNYFTDPAVESPLIWHCVWSENYRLSTSFPLCRDQAKGIFNIL